MSQQIDALLKDILAELARIRVELHALSVRKHPVEKELLDNCGTKRFLEISTRTLSRRRKDNEIHPIKIGKKDYYLRSELMKSKKKK